MAVGTPQNQLKSDFSQFEMVIDCNYINIYVLQGPDYH